MENDALEVSLMVWLDDEFDSWIYSILTTIDGEESIIAWGECDSRDDAAASGAKELYNYVSGV